MTQFVGVNDGEESPFAISWRTHTCDVGCQVATVLDKPLEPAFEIGEPLQEFGLKGLNRKERDQADHGTDLHRRAFAIGEDRKSTRLNSSHVRISYAVFCLKKKNNTPLPLMYHPSS